MDGETKIRGTTISSSIEFLLVLYVVLRSGVVAVMTMNATFNIVDICVAVAAIAYLVVKRIKIDFGAAMVVLFIVFWVVSMALVHQDPVQNIYLRLIVDLVVVLLITKIVPFSTFSRHFTRLITVLAAASLFFYVLQPILKDLYQQAPLLVNQGSATYHNLFIWVTYVDKPERNFGVFWEPGAYQVFLNLALLFALSESNMSNKSKTVTAVICIVAIGTTYSTTGYFVCLLVLLLSFLEQAIGSSRRRIFAVVGIVAVLVVAGFALDNDIIVGKFRPESTGYTSFEDRYNATLLDLQIMRDSPAFGVGIARYLPTRNELGSALGLPSENTPNTYSMLGATLGVLPSGFYILQQLRWSWAYRPKRPRLLSFVFVSSIVIILFATEPFFYLKLGHVFFWYGLAAHGKHSDVQGEIESRSMRLCG